MDTRTENILNEVRAGCSYAAVGRHYGVSRQRIEQIAKKYGLTTEHKKKEALEKKNLEFLKREKRIGFLEKKSRIQEAVQAVSEGMHPARAAIKYQVRYQSLTNAMTNCGVFSEASRERPRYSPSRVAAVIELIEQSKLDNDEISWATSVSYSTVRTLRKNLRRSFSDQ